MITPSTCNEQHASESTEPPDDKQFIITMRNRLLSHYRPFTDTIYPSYDSLISFITDNIYWFERFDFEVALGMLLNSTRPIDVNTYNLLLIELDYIWSYLELIYDNQLPLKVIEYAISYNTLMTQDLEIYTDATKFNQTCGFFIYSLLTKTIYSGDYKFDPVKSDLSASLSISFMISFLLQSNRPISESKRSELITMSRDCLKRVRSILNGSVDDYLNDFKDSSLGYALDNPYVAKYYIANHIDPYETSKSKLNAFDTLMKIYYLLMGALVINHIDISKYIIDIQLIPKLYNAFDDVSEEYGFDFIHDILLSSLNILISVDDEVIDELDEYLKGLMSIDEVLFKALVNEIHGLPVDEDD